MVKVRTVVRYVYLVTRNTWTPVLGASRQITRARTYDYDLDHDNTVKNLGGGVDLNSASGFFISL